MDLELYAMVFTPLAAAFFGAVFFRRSKWGAAVLSVASAALALALALRVMLSGAGDFSSSFELFKLGNFKFDFGLLWDGAARNMIFAVCFVGFLIHVFSVGYMDDDPDKGRYFAGLSFFMFSMTGLVLSSNLFEMFVFWEFVGFSSYALIAHYCGTQAAAEASKKAFIVNRVGDFGFLLGILYCYSAFGTTDFAELGKLLGEKPALANAAMGFLVVCGFLGKSAQFPLQVWLPDAMAGPTPVSALIHAATMVAAGVFLLVRLCSIGFLTPEVLDFILIVCSAMAFCAGLWALGQNDIKKILAYSTLAHLGLMGAGVAIGYELAMFHLTTHAFFKAALFLVAGSIIHACAHEQDIFKMGGLFKRMPVTSAVALAAVLSIIAIPYFSGYYSKEAILTAAFGRAQAGDVLDKAAFWLIMGAAALTPVYMGRLFFNVFFGKPRSEAASRARESSLWMLVPLAVLALYSVAGAWGVEYGMLWSGGKMSGLIPAAASDFIAPLLEARRAGLETISNVHMFEWIALAVTFAGIAVAYVVYGGGKGYDVLERRCPPIYSALRAHGWFDCLYDWYVAKVQQRVAVFLATAVDLLLIEFVCVRGLGMLCAVTGFGIRKLHCMGISAQVGWLAAGLAFLALLILT